MRVPILLLANSLTVAGASAQCISEFVMNASPGDNMTMSMTMPLSGTWKGNYNPQSNPTGTITIPGLFGSGPNTPIAYSLVVKPSVTINFPQGIPVFTFCVEADGKGGATVTCGSLDIVRGTPAPLTINLVVTYSDFHTFNPSATFPGISNVEVPGPAGTVNDVTGVQAAPAAGVITDGPGDSLILTATIPMNIVSSVTVLEQTVIGEPTLVLMPMVAQLVPSLQGDYTAIVDVDIPPAQSVLPLAGESFVDQPLPLPTFLPPGNTANLLMSGTFADGTVTFGLSMTLSGAGSSDGDPPDFNCDGVVDGDDLGTLLGAWGKCPGCVQDLNGDGVVDGDDLGTLLGAWS